LLQLAGAGLAVPSLSAASAGRLVTSTSVPINRTSTLQSIPAGVHTSIVKGRVRQVPMRTITDKSLLAALAPLEFLIGFEEFGVRYQLSKPLEYCLEPPDCGPTYVDYLITT
jgi:hypothetical protein